MSENAEIGVMPQPTDFKYARTAARGRAVHNGDYFSLRQPHIS